MQRLRLAGVYWPCYRRLFAIAGVCVGLAGCVPEEGSDTAVSPDAVLNATANMISGSGVAATPRALDFSTYLDELLLVLGRNGGGAFAYTIDSDQQWLSVDKPSATTGGSWTWVYVRVDRAGLSSGAHTGALSINVPGQSPEVVDVRMVVSTEASTADLYVSTQQLDFGYETNALGFVVGSGALNEVAYTLEADADWVSLSSTSGSSAGTYEQVVVTVDRAGLGPGTHTGIVRVEAATGESREVAILVRIAGGDALSPTLEVSQNLLDFGDETMTVTFALHNGGPGAFGYYIASEVGWLAISPNEGENSGEQDEITVAVNRSQLSPGSYVASVVIVADNGLERELWATVVVPDPSEPTDEQILAWLRELEPLRKVHYSWPVRVELHRGEIDPRLREYVRLAHAACVSVKFLTADDVDLLVGLCKEINDTDPSVAARFGLEYEPWHQVWPEDAPPTYTGPEHDEEIGLCRAYLERFRAWLDAANAKHGTAIELGAIVLNCEVFYRMEEDEAGYEPWNAAIDAKYNAIHLVCKDVFPDATVIWFARGSMTPCAAPEGWCPSPHFTLNEFGDVYSCSLYRVPEIFNMRERMRRTHELGLERGCGEVIPWVALGAGYKRSAEVSGYWALEWDYDMVYSWMLGGEIDHPWYGNQPERFAPWNAAPAVVFYPEPFGRAPYWAKHFVAYVRGANLIEALPE